MNIYLIIVKLALRLSIPEGVEYHDLFVLLNNQI